MNTIKNVDLKDKIVLVRTDYNVPMENGEITDNLRIKASLPTLEYLLKNGAKKLILMSHLGRPGGKRTPELSLKPVAKELQKLLPETKIEFIGEVYGPEVEQAVENLPEKGILLLENLRFYPEEEENSEEFARDIAESTRADLFVQDGFAVVHRAHASTEAIVHELPSVAGLLLEKELKNLTEVAENPKHPFMVVIGGAKVEDKQPLIDKFEKIADIIAVGGKIAADGYQTALSNVYVAEDFSDAFKRDLGEKSTEKILDFAKSAKTVLWNGALGQAEIAEFAKSSTKLAEFLGKSPEVTSVICGGDTTGFVENLQKSDPDLKFTLVSTGGGAALELLTGAALPGVEALAD